jgi:hypothetical protein
MNEIITLLIPFVSLNFIFRFIQYICNSNRCDKIISLITITVLQLTFTIFLISFLNNMGFNLLLFLSIIVIILTNALHMALDNQDLNIRVSKGHSFIIIILLQNLILISLYYYFH